MSKTSSPHPPATRPNTLHDPPSTSLLIPKLEQGQQRRTKVRFTWTNSLSITTTLLFSTPLNVIADLTNSHVHTNRIRGTSDMTEKTSIKLSNMLHYVTYHYLHQLCVEIVKYSSGKSKVNTFGVGTWYRIFRLTIYFLICNENYKLIYFTK